MLWLLTDLFNTLPEVGDMDKPKIAFFFDEAHLVFSDMPAYRLKQIVQVVKLIRSRGIGLYFISQNPTDIPSEILGQLGNKIQHNLRAFTPAEQKIVKAAADGFRTNPNFNTEEAILNLGTGEALVSFQNEKGEPEVVEKVTILPPQSKMGVIDDLSRNKVINSSLIAGKYEEAIDNESAHEIINKQIEEQQAEEARIKEEQEQAKREAEEQKQREKEEKEKAKQEAAEQKQKEKEAKEAEKKKKNSFESKLTKKVVNKTTDKLINKGLNSLFKNFFK
jgi:DNA helicase HerA-like ATPase